MGNWGFGIKENDIAMDLIGDLCDGLLPRGSLDQVINKLRKKYCFDPASDDFDEDALYGLVWELKARGLLIPPDLLQTATARLQAGPRDGWVDMAKRAAVEQEFLAILEGCIPHPGPTDDSEPD